MMPPNQEAKGCLHHLRKATLANGCPMPALQALSQKVPKSPVCSSCRELALTTPEVTAWSITFTGAACFAVNPGGPRFARCMACGCWMRWAAESCTSLVQQVTKLPSKAHRVMSVPSPDKSHNRTNPFGRRFELSGKRCHFAHRLK